MPKWRLVDGSADIPVVPRTHDNGLDLEGRAFESIETRHQEGKTAIRQELLSPQGLSLELRCFPTGDYHPAPPAFA